ncbi:MAG: phage terminase large subunit [Actinobacteria bacterium]|nr:phage terminase large subunit [Actinomycetota bacterium]
MHFSSAERTLARASPAAFAHLVSGGAYLPFDHLVALDEQLTRLAAGEIERLVVSMPPRHGKSETVSRYLPAWYLGRHPERRVMLACYESAFAASWGRKARELLERHGEELFGVRVARGSASDWGLAGRRGGMVTAGVGGALTGKGANLLIIDDPVKNAEEAQSQLLRAKAWDWWRSTARTRLQRPGAVVLVMTRWHEDDLAGRLLDEGHDDWTVLELAGVAEDDDPLGRGVGEPLCPQLGFDADWLAATRSELGGYWFSALYQQRPAPAEGMLFKRRDFRYWQDDPERELYLLEADDGSQRPVGKAWCTHFQTVDVAASAKHSADYTVVSTWAVTPDRDLVLVDCERQRFESLDVAGFVTRAYRRQAHPPRFIGVEDFGFGLTIVQQLSRDGLPVTRLKPDKDKVARALVAVARYEQQTVYHPRGAAWLDDWEQELVAFPNAAHDDQVDTLSYAARQVERISVGSARQTPARSRGAIFAGIRDKPL